MEVVARRCRMSRATPPRLDIATRDRFVARFQQQVGRRHVIININRAILTRAAALRRTHPLRAYDAVQLA